MLRPQAYDFWHVLSLLRVSFHSILSLSRVYSRHFSKVIKRFCWSTIQTQMGPITVLYMISWKSIIIGGGTLISSPPMGALSLLYMVGMLYPDGSPFSIPLSIMLTPYYAPVTTLMTQRFWQFLFEVNQIQCHKDNPILRNIPFENINILILNFVNICSLLFSQFKILFNPLFPKSQIPITVF